MATELVMPALGMAQETGTLVAWLKQEGELVTKGEPVMEVETDKATVEVEAPASGRLTQVSAKAGDVVPVGRAIAYISAVDEEPASPPAVPARPAAHSAQVVATPLARKIAQENNLDLAQVKPGGGRVTKEDVLGFLASPKARRMAKEANLDITRISGSGPEGAVLAGDVAAFQNQALFQELDQVSGNYPEPAEAAPSAQLSATWRTMAERMAQSWTSAPHFYLVREVNASGIIEMRSRVAEAVQKRTGTKLTYTDLLIKLCAASLAGHPHLNAGWSGSEIKFNPEINLGMAVGIEDGLVVPVIHQAGSLSLGEIASQRQDLITRANEHHLRPADLTGGTFTLTNLGMYSVDAFMAVLNPPQAAVLAVGRIADRVVAENGQPVVRPTIILTLSCDHRVVDGMRAAKFLDDLANLLAEPWGILA